VLLIRSDGRRSGSHAGKLFLTDRPARSAFWVLLTLAAVIAVAGVVADSVATVIGAMIVAPLMTPILGTALALVLADRRHLVRSVASPDPQTDQHSRGT
jgi:uncharacterized membrane protein